MVKDSTSPAPPQQTNANNLQCPVTLLRGLSPNPTGYTVLDDVFNRMRTTDPTKRKQVLALRQTADHAKRTGNEEAYKDQKKGLPGFLVGKWTHRADAPENCAEYLPFMVLDFDYSHHYEGNAPPFSDEMCRAVFDKLRTDPHTFAAFLSPSGGLRAMVQTESNLHNHRETYARLMDYYSRVIRLPILKSKQREGRKIANAPFAIDPTCINESRFFYFVEGLANEEFYLNENSRVFSAEYAPQPNESQKVADTTRSPPKPHGDKKQPH